MSIGYACLTVGVPGTKQRTCSLKTVSPDILKSLIQANLNALDRILDYNIANEIKLFRISSDIIPFGSHPANTLRWWEIFSGQLHSIGEKARTNGIRLSMHPGQYTVLNSPDEEVVKHAVEDLLYHCRFMDALELGQQSKMILHIGGIYGDKAAAVERFICQYRNLDTGIKRRLIIENDDRQYTIADVLEIGKSENIPVVFDNLHHEVNPDNSKTETEWIDTCNDTWRLEDGPQKLHYSQQAVNKRLGSHSSTIEAGKFLDFYSRLQKPQPDIMLEVKDKNLSAVKCINATSAPDITRLEREWSRYKYMVLENSPQIYRQIRELLKNKPAYPVLEFYRLVDQAMDTPAKPGNAVNAAQHVWGYVKKSAGAREHLAFEKNLDKLSKGNSGTAAIKRQLWKLALAQQQKYLLNSLYFMELVE